MLGLLLPFLQINTITVGGISAGCFMATMVHFAFSSIVKGNFCTAGGPYYCAQGNLDIALTQCMSAQYSPFINTQYLSKIVNNTAISEYIDPVHTLANSRVLLYSSLNDSIVSQTVVQKNAELYTIYNANVSTLFDHIGEHAVVTNTFGNDCMTLGSPYINNCGFDAAQYGLKYLYDDILDRDSNGTIYQFDQTAYMPVVWSPDWGLSNTGYLYIPHGCYLSPCHLHISFHGCKQTVDSIGLDYVHNTGYNGFDNVVVLYPQALASTLNPEGCFDWWGYTGPEYASNIGVQLATVRNMLKSFDFPLYR